MQEEGLVPELKQLWFLYRARRQWTKGNSCLARQRLDQALALGDQSNIFTLAMAFDAYLEMGQGNSSNALSKLSECLALLDLNGRMEDQYVVAYCRFCIQVYDENVGFDEIEQTYLGVQSLRKEASGFQRMVLPLLSIKSLKEILGQRRSTNKQVYMLYNPYGDTEYSVSFKF